jgi:hypothetical protein
VYDGFDVSSIVPRHENFVGGVAKHLAPVFAVLFEVRRQLRGKLQTLCCEAVNQCVGHGSTKLPVRLRRAVAARAEIAHFVFRLHHQHRLLLSIALAKMTQQCGECAAVTPTIFG